MFRSKQQRKTQDNRVRSFDRYNKNLIKCETTHKIETIIVSLTKSCESMAGHLGTKLRTNYNTLKSHMNCNS